MGKKFDKKCFIFEGRNPDGNIRPLISMTETFSTTKNKVPARKREPDIQMRQRSEGGWDTYRGDDDAGSRSIIYGEGASAYFRDHGNYSFRRSNENN